MKFHYYLRRITLYAILAVPGIDTLVPLSLDDNHLHFMCIFVDFLVSWGPSLISYLKLVIPFSYVNQNLLELDFRIFRCLRMFLHTMVWSCSLKVMAAGISSLFGQVLIGILLVIQQVLTL